MIVYGWPPHLPDVIYINWPTLASLWHCDPFEKKRKWWYKNRKGERERERERERKCRWIFDNLSTIDLFWLLLLIGFDWGVCGWAVTSRGCRTLIGRRHGLWEWAGDWIGSIRTFRFFFHLFCLIFCLKANVFPAHWFAIEIQAEAEEEQEKQHNNNNNSNNNKEKK